MPGLAGHFVLACPMSWFVYILECRGGRLYTGISNDVARRYAAHAAGKGARFTRSFPPEQLLLQLAFPDKGTALSAELAIKAMSAAQKRTWIASLQPASPDEAAAPIKKSTA